MFLLLDIKKENIKSNLVLYLSLILVTGSLFQVLSIGLFENNDHSLVIKIHSIYAQDDGGGDESSEPVEESEEQEPEQESEVEEYV
jgi:hypothetical protein